MSKKSSIFAADFAPMSEQNHYIVDLKRQPIGTHLFDFQLDSAFFASLEKSEILSGEVSARAVLNLREEGYQLTIAVQGTVFVVCDRCLDPMPLDIDANDEMSLLDSGGHRQSSVLNDAAELPNGEIDLSWLAYEIVSINIPIVHSHHPGECNKQMELLLQDHLCAEPEPSRSDPSDCTTTPSSW